MMIRLLPVLLILLIAGGCDRDTTRVGPRGQEAVHQATADLSVIADFVRSAKPWLAVMMQSYAGSIEHAVPLAPDVEKQIGPQGEAPLAPKINAAALAAADADPSGQGALLADTVKADQRRTDNEVSAEQEEMARPWYQRVFTWEGALTALSVLAGALKVASMFGVPWARAAESAVVSVISSGVLRDKTEPLRKGMEDATRIAAAAGNLAESSEAGRWGLRLLNKYLDDDTKTKLNERIAKMTHGQAADVEELFKLLASAHATDKKVGAEVSSYLQTVRDNMETDGGVPPIVKKLLSAV